MNNNSTEYSDSHTEWTITIPIIDLTRSAAVELNGSDVRLKRVRGEQEGGE